MACRCDTEHDDFRAALDWLFQTRDLAWGFGFVLPCFVTGKCANSSPKHECGWRPFYFLPEPLTRENERRSATFWAHLRPRRETSLLRRASWNAGYRSLRR